MTPINDSFSNPDISIIVPVYNSEKYIRDTVESIIAQDFDRVEILLVDDGSTDMSIDVAKEIIRDDLRFKIVRAKHGGVSHARNIGIKMASGRYILFLDSDDKLEHNALNTLYEKCIKGGHEMAFFGTVATARRKTKVSNNIKMYKTAAEFVVGNWLWGVCGKIIKKECIITPFDEKTEVAEDALFWVENGQYIKDYIYTSDELYFYNIHEGSITQTKLINERSAAELDAIEKMISIIQDECKTILEAHYVHRYIAISYTYSGNRKKFRKKYKKKAKKMYIKSIKAMKFMDSVKLFLKWHFPVILKLK